MTEAAAMFPPLWPGSTRTTLPRRMPAAVGGNRAGPPLAALGSAGGEAALLPAAVSGRRLAEGVAEAVALAPRAAGSLRWDAGVEDGRGPGACPAGGPL